MEHSEIKIINKDMIKQIHKNEHEPYEYYKYEIASRDNGNKSFVAIYEIPPKKENYPYHYHISNEEVFYIMSGSGILETCDGNKEIKAGDFIVCPPSSKSAHKLINSSEDEMLVYLECDTINSPDVLYYPKSSKVGILVDGKRGVFYNKDTNIEYYEGE